jgi:hypothetical protein
VFFRAQKIIEERRVDISEQEMLVRLRKVLMKRGRLTPAIIKDAVGLPCTATYRHHFGSLRNAYRLIGYTSTRDCDYLESRQAWADLSARLRSQLAEGIKKAGGRVTSNHPPDCVHVNGATSVSFRVARWCPGRRAYHSPHWSIHRRVRLPAGWVVAIRLAEHNKNVLDYLLFPTTNFPGPLFRFSESVRARRRIDRYESFDALMRTLTRRVATTRTCASTKSSPPKRPRTHNHAARRNGRERR